MPRRVGIIPTPSQSRREELLNLVLMRVPLKQCAERMGVNLRTIQRDVSSPEFRAEFEVLSGRVQAKVADKVAREKTRVVRKLEQKKLSLAERIHQASGQAIDKLEELIESEHQGLALKACDSVLDRNAETARNRRIEGDMQGRFSIDPMTLMHVAMVAREIEMPDRRGNYEEILPPARERETNQEESHD